MTTPAIDIEVAEKVFGWEFLAVGYFQNGERATNPQPGDAGPRQYKLRNWLDRATEAAGLEPSVGDYFIDVDTLFITPTEDHRFSTDLVAGWEVLMKMQSRLPSKRFRFYDALRKAVPVDGVYARWPDALGILGDKFPMAVCKAAIEAI